MQEQKVSKSLEAYNRLKERIRRFRLMPGQKLIYRDLEEELGMSRTPVINGLMMLEKDGVVVNKLNRGFYVRDMSVKEAEDIYDIREVLDVTAVRFAIARYEPEELEALRRHVEAYKARVDGEYDKEMYELDTNIHIHIARMGKNTYFVSMLEKFYESIYFNMDVAALRPQINAFKEDHDELLKAMEKRDEESASHIIVRHIRMARELFVAFMRNLEGA